MERRETPAGEAREATASSPGEQLELLGGDHVP